MALIDAATTWGTTTLNHYIHSGALKCSGSTIIHDSQLNQANLSGATKITQSTAKAITALGSFQATDCTFETAASSGSSNLTRCVVMNDLTASGCLNLTASKVQRAIFSGKEMKATNSAIEELVVKEVGDNSWKVQLFGCFNYESASNCEQRVELDGADCKVGQVRFEKAGTVLLKNGAAAPTVINGEVVVS